MTINPKVQRLKDKQMALREAQIPPIPDNLRGQIWTTEDPEDHDDWVEEEVWRALHYYLYGEDAFLTVEGNELRVCLAWFGLERSFSLEEALMWDIDGFQNPRTGKIDPASEIGDPEEQADHARGIAQLRELRTVLAKMIARIDASIPEEGA